MKRAYPILSAALLGGLLALTGCGGRESAVEAGDRDQVLHLSIGAEPEGLDPHLITSVAASDVLRVLMEGLVSLDARDLSPVPGAAESWEVSEDGLVYTFHLREDGRWSNGDPVTAEDFLFSYRRMLSPRLGSQYAYMLWVVENARAYNTGGIDDFSQVGFQAPDERTLVVRLAHPTPYFLSLITHASWYPVHPDTILAHGRIDDPHTPWTRPGRFVSNGPFTLTEWRTHQHIVARPNPHYWDRETVRLNEVRLHPIASPDTEDRAFRSGQIHITKNAPPERITAYKRDRPEIVHSAPYLGVYYFRFNTEREGLSDPRVRRALSLAIDRESLVRNVLHGHMDPAWFFTPPDTAGYTSESRVEFDPEAARELLAEAGFPGGEGFPRFELLFNTQDTHRRIAEALQQMWREHLNVHITLVNQEWQVYLASVRGGNYDIGRAAWIGDYHDPNTFLDMWVTDGGNNNTGWSNTRYDDLIEAAARADGPEERHALFQEAEAILLEELPVTPVYHYRSAYLVSPSVRGWQANVLDHQQIKHIWLEPLEE